MRDEVIARCVWGQRFRDNAARFRRILGRIDLSPMDSLELRDDIQENERAAADVVKGATDDDVVRASRDVAGISTQPDAKALYAELARRGLLA